MLAMDYTGPQEWCRRRFVSSDTTFLFPTASPSQSDEVEDAWELDLMTLERESNDRGPERVYARGEDHEMRFVGVA